MAIETWKFLPFALLCLFIALYNFCLYLLFVNFQMVFFFFLLFH